MLVSSMLREIAHFVRHAPETIRLQRRCTRAEFLDEFMARADAQGFSEERRELVGDLTGRVLEIGCGTGAVFRYYGEGAQVEGIEPEEDFLALAKSKPGVAAGKIRAAAGDGMNLDFPDGSFDAVVLCTVLCSVPSMDQVLGEAFRVLRPGGLLRTLDHVRSEAPVAGRLMDVTNPLWLRLNQQGCHWNREPLGPMSAAGFTIEDVRAVQRFDTLFPAFPMRRVKAHK